MIHGGGQSYTHALLRGVSVIEPNKKPAVVHPREILVEHCCLGMANVQVATGFGRETGYNFAFDRIGETESERGSSLVAACLVRFRLCCTSVEL